MLKIKNWILRKINKFLKRKDCSVCYYMNYCQNKYYGFKGQCKSFVEMNKRNRGAE